MKRLLILILIPFLNFGQTPCLDAVANATGAIGEFIPQCEDDGSYSPIQCWSSTGYCWCVDEDGVEIPGTSLGPGEGNPDCGIILGCIDDTACNYNIDIITNDGSCLYPGDSYLLLTSTVSYCCTYNAICQEDCVVVDIITDWGNCIEDISINDFINPKKLNKSIDMLGRETITKGFQLHIYDDGSVEKKYLIK
tara:strand:+ start:2602 stop:3183 length:582 start_codon:yes stop_codon:yes gene_type:complete